LASLDSDLTEIDLQRETDGTIVNVWGRQSGVPSPLSPGDAAWLDAVVTAVVGDVGVRRPSPTSTPVPARSSADPDNMAIEPVPEELMDLECYEIDPSGTVALPGTTAAAAEGSATPTWPPAASDSDDGFSVKSEPTSPAVPEVPVPVALYQTGATSEPTPIERAVHILGRPLRPPPLRLADMVTVAANTNIADVDRVVIDLYRRHTIAHTPAVLTHIFLGMIAVRTHFAGRIMEQLEELQLTGITSDDLIMALFDYLTEEFSRGTITLP